MDERSIKSWWQRRLPDISAAAARFPLAIGLAASLTAFKLLRGSMIGATEVRIIAWLAGGFVCVLAVDLFVESQRRSFRARVLLWDLAVARHRDLAEPSAAARGADASAHRRRPSRPRREQR